MRASDICTSKVVCIDASASVVDAAKRMREGHVGALVVTEQPNGERIPVGIVTDRDIVMSVVAQEVAPGTLKVADVMASPVLTCTEEQHLYEIVALMRSRAVRRLPVVNIHGGLAGLVTADDVYSALGMLLREMNAALTKEQVHERVLRT